MKKTKELTQAQKDRNMLKFIMTKGNAGFNGLQLKKKGHRNDVHGSLRDAEQRGLLQYLDGGWYRAEDLRFFESK